MTVTGMWAVSIGWNAGTRDGSPHEERGAFRDFHPCESVHAQSFTFLSEYDSDFTQESTSCNQQSEVVKEPHRTSVEPILLLPRKSDRMGKL